MQKCSISIKPESITKNLKTSIPLSFMMVFLDCIYIAIAAAVFTTFWIIFSIFDQLLYFSPILYFYLPDDAVAGFVITNITSASMGVLVAMNVYVIRNSKIKLDRSLFSAIALSHYPLLQRRNSI